MRIYYAIDVKSGTWDIVYTKGLAEALLNRGMIVSEIPKNATRKNLHETMPGIVKKFQEMLLNKEETCTSSVQAAATMS